MLKSITINGLRGFGKECTINFSLPNKEDVVIIPKYAKS